MMPNTRAAHRLVAWATAENSAAGAGAGAGAAGQPALLIDRLFTAYFMDGKDIGNPDVLERIGLACGLDAAGIADHFAVSRRGEDIALPRSLQAGEVRGVPHFAIDSAKSLSGAHSSGAILDAMMRSINDQDNR